MESHVVGTSRVRPERIYRGEPAPRAPADGEDASRWRRTLIDYLPAVLPFLVPVLLQVGYRFLVSVVMMPGPGLGAEDSASSAGLGFTAFDSLSVQPLAQAADEANARLAWVASVVVLASVCIAVWVMSCYWVVRCMGEKRRRSSAAMLLAAAVVGASIPVLTLRTGILLKGVQDYVVTWVFLSTPNPFAPAFRLTVPWLGALCMLLSVAGVTMGLAACTAVGTSCAHARDVSKLAESMRKLQHVLFAGALLLIAAVIEFRALFIWAAASAGGANAAAVTDIGSTAAASLGVVYALALAAIYFPAALILSKRARDRARAAFPNRRRPPLSSEIDGWLQANGLVLSTPKSLSTFAAVLSPLLAQAPAAALLDLLK
jgi:uncharacterized membrane protein YhaH (DUF805 family)